MLDLIDRSKLGLSWHETNHYIGQGIYESYYAYDSDDIKNAPRIDAIPVDFIKKYIKVNAIKKNDNQGYWAIKMLLKAWKEENERER